MNVDEIGGAANEMSLTSSLSSNSNNETNPIPTVNATAEIAE